MPSRSNTDLDTILLLLQQEHESLVNFASILHAQRVDFMSRIRNRILTVQHTYGNGFDARP